MADPRIRRSPHLVLYWRNGRLLICNYATGDVVETTPDICSLLDYCDQWRTLPAVAAHLQIDGTLARRLVRSLASRGLIQGPGRARDPRDEAMSALEGWNPAAGFFHAVSRQVKFVSPAAAKRMTERRARAMPMPPPVKRLRGAPRVALGAPDLTGDFASVLLSRRTWRRFGKGPVAQVDLATTLALSVGVQQWVPTRFGRLPLKTSPSGGARHPIEAYVCVREVSGIRPGLYHYAADVHHLERIRGGDMTPRLREWMPHSGYFATAAFVVVLTAVLDRQVWRYPYARAYRAALAEAGHVCQTFCLAATWRGLAPFCLMGLDDPRIEEDLGLDGVRETVLYVAGAGTRPRGAAWAPRARGSLRARRNPVFRPA